MDDFFFPHVVSIRTVSRGGLDTKYGAPRDVACEVRDKQEVVRTADGAEVVSSSQVTVGPDEDVSLGALVTVWKDRPGEREAPVIAIARNENDADLGSYLVLFLK